MFLAKTFSSFHFKGDHFITLHKLTDNFCSNFCSHSRTRRKSSFVVCQQYITELNSISGFTLQVRYIQALTGLYSKLLSCDFYHCEHNFLKIRIAKVRISNSKKDKRIKKTVKTVLITPLALIAKGK